LKLEKFEYFDPVTQEQDREFTYKNPNWKNHNGKLALASPTPKRRTVNQIIREPDTRANALATLKTGREMKHETVTSGK
jgi:hypothetical protein